MGYFKKYHKGILYKVQVLDEISGYTHIAISRKDGRPIVSTWDVLQSIKNEYAGEDRYAVEVFPDESSVVYEENMRHLWVFPEGVRLDLGPRWEGQGGRSTLC